MVDNKGSKLTSDQPGGGGIMSVGGGGETGQMIGFEMGGTGGATSNGARSAAISSAQSASTDIRTSEEGKPLGSRLETAVYEVGVGIWPISSWVDEGGNRQRM